jgi:hypothetical protein
VLLLSQLRSDHEIPSRILLKKRKDEKGTEAIAEELECELVDVVRALGLGFI